MFGVDEVDLAAAPQALADHRYGYDVGADPWTGRIRIGAADLLHLEIGLNSLSPVFGVRPVAGVPEIACREALIRQVKGRSMVGNVDPLGGPRVSTGLRGRDRSASAFRPVDVARRPMITESLSGPNAGPADRSPARNRVLLEPVMGAQVGMAAAAAAAGGLAEIAAEALRRRRGIVRHRADHASANMILASVPLAELADHGRRLDGRLARRAWCDIRCGGHRPVPDGTDPSLGRPDRALGRPTPRRRAGRCADRPRPPSTSEAEPPPLELAGSAVGRRDPRLTRQMRRDGWRQRRAALPGLTPSAASSSILDHSTM